MLDFVETKKSINFAGASPDGGIGRRAGLKHQWSNPCRFDPGSGYKRGFQFDWNPLFVLSWVTGICDFGVENIEGMRKVFVFAEKSINFAIRV